MKGGSAKGIKNVIKELHNNQKEGTCSLRHEVLLGMGAPIP